MSEYTVQTFINGFICKQNCLSECYALHLVIRYKNSTLSSCGGGVHVLWPSQQQDHMETVEIWILSVI